ANKEIHYIRPYISMSTGVTKDYLVRIRYRQPLQEARLYKTDDGLYIIFKELQRGITAGQFAAWYDGEELIGSGVISK
ncbi:MAG: tRNA 2-thiouridine(34) synthase MnmA, partial [Bacteroidales bacterium]|nr:tRNA 2-thiouridine(34) synthase MnmA [Bacteroidales bacterium]